MSTPSAGFRTEAEHLRSVAQRFGADAVGRGSGVRLQSAELDMLVPAGSSAAPRRHADAGKSVLRIEVARWRMYVPAALALRRGQVLAVDTAALGEVRVWVADRLVARGELIVQGEHYAVRVSEVVPDSGQNPSTAA